MLEDLAADTAHRRSRRRCCHSARAWCWSASRFSVLQQLVGLNAISYYGPQILERMGYHMDAAFLGVLIARCLNLLATMVVVLIVDRVGRKPLLIFGGIVMGLSMMALGTLFASGNTGTPRPRGDLLLHGRTRHVVRSHRVDHDVGDLSGAHPRPGHVVGHCGAVVRELPGVGHRSRCCSATPR